MRRFIQYLFNLTVQNKFFVKRELEDSIKKALATSGFVNDLKPFRNCKLSHADVIRTLMVMEVLIKSYAKRDCQSRSPHSFSAGTRSSQM